MILIIFSSLYIFPWKQMGIDTGSDFLNKPYTLGLDLQGGVELDYQVDLSAVKNTETNASDPMATQNSESVIVEGLKKIIDDRVGSL